MAAATIKVWACVEADCDYWRDEKKTGVHIVFVDNGPGRRHDLQEVEYVQREPVEALLAAAEKMYEDEWRGADDARDAVVNRRAIEEIRDILGGADD